VTDSVGPTTVTLTFVPNRAPGATGLAATKRKIRYDNSDTATITALTLVDADGDPVFVDWRIVSGPAASGAFLSSTTGQSTGLTVDPPTTGNPSTGGVWRIGAVVTDRVQDLPETTIDVLAYPSFAKDVWPVFAGSCATTACHADAYSAAGSVIHMPNAATTHAGLVNMPSFRSGLFRVKPNQYQASYLWQLVYSGSMPRGAAQLSADKLSIIRNWIEPEGYGTSGTLSAGAENN
jgi:hypothetical protein